MISPERNRRLWEECGWKKEAYEQWPSGQVYDMWASPYHELPPLGLPSPADLSFVGYLLRDALPKVREKIGRDCFYVLLDFDCELGTVEARIENVNSEFSGVEPTPAEALFTACYSALGLDKEE